MLANISDLPYMRQAALKTKSPALSVIKTYDRAIQAFVTFSNDVAAGTGNATLQSDVTVLNALLRMEDDASLQRAYLYQALASTPAGLTPSALQDLNQATEQQAADTLAFDQSASVAEQQNFNNTVAGPSVDEAKSAEKLAIATTASANQAAEAIGNPQTCASAHAPALGPAACWLQHPERPRSSRCATSVTAWSATSRRRPTRWSRTRCTVRSSSPSRRCCCSSSSCSSRPSWRDP